MSMANEAYSKSSLTDESENGGIRQWIEQLRNANLLNTVKARVDWDLEISAIARICQSHDGPGLLFENIKDYQDTISTQFLTASYNSLAQAKLLFGLPAETSEKNLVKHIKKVFRQSGIQPVVVDTGPVKENILQGEEIDLFQFPMPMWNELDGGQYSDTFCATVTRDPVTGLENIGNYRGQAIAKNKIGKVMAVTQGVGGHFTSHKQKQHDGMPIAIAYGVHDLITVCASTPFPKHMCEWDVVGAIQGTPLQLVECETVPLNVPAAAEIIVEGYVSTDPTSFEDEGPFAEYPAYSGGKPGRKPVINITCITHRNNPIMRGTSEGARVGFLSETFNIIRTSWTGEIWNRIEDAGISNMTDIYLSPITAATNVIVQIRKTYSGHAQQIANALWGMNTAQYAFKNIIVVEEDIDVRNWHDVEWAIAFRTDPSQGQLLTFGPTFGSPLDPSTAPEFKNMAKYKTGRWTRLLIDATRTWEYDERPEWEGRRFPPLTKIPAELEKKIHERWQELGIDLEYPDDEGRERLTCEELNKIMPQA